MLVVGIGTSGVYLVPLLAAPGGAESLTLVGPDARRDPARLGDLLVAEGGAMADPRFRHSLRLRRETGLGRRGLSAAEVRSGIATLGPGGLEVIEGPWYTDVRAVTVDRLEAFERLRSSLSPASCRAPLHVVGGPAVDARLLGTADGRHVIRNAGPELRALVARLPARLTSRSDQAGLLEVVRRTLHGRAGRCRACAPAALPPSDAALVEVLGVQDRGRWGRLAFVLHPADAASAEGRDLTQPSDTPYLEPGR